MTFLTLEPKLTSSISRSHHSVIRVASMLRIMFPLLFSNQTSMTLLLKSYVQSCHLRATLKNPNHLIASNTQILFVEIY
jgi:hypothetical protein